MTVEKYLSSGFFCGTIRRCILPCDLVNHVVVNSDTVSG